MSALATVTGARAGAPRTTPLQGLLIPAAVVTLLVAVLQSGQYTVIALLLGAAAGAYVLIPNSPVWALVPLLVTEMSVSAYIITSLGMSLRLATVLAALALTGLGILRQGNLLDLNARRVLLPSVLLMVVATLVNSEFSDSSYTDKYLRYQVSQFLVLVLAAYLIRSRDDLKKIAWAAFALGLLGALFTLWQHWDRGSVPYGARYIGANRAVGLGTSSVLLPNQMFLVLMPVLGLLAAGPWRRDRQRLMLAASAGALALAAYFSYTRSALIAIGAGLLALGLCVKGKPRVLFLSAVIGGVLAYQVLQGTGLIGARYYEGASDNSSAASHQALWDVGLAVALDHAVIGIGHEHFEEVSVNYVDVLSGSDAAGAGAIGEDRPHNDFLSVWISWGIVALIAYLGIFLGAIRNCLIAARSNDVLIRGLAIGCAGGLAAYAVNSAFHNYLDSSVALWLFAGFSVALARLADTPRPRVLERTTGAAPARPRFYGIVSGNAR